MLYIFNERAYAKMIFHAAKYPHLGINGILLASKENGHIVDAIPLFHQNLFVTPLVEVALMQTDCYAENDNLTIAGYYVASDHFNENSVDKVPASKIAEKIYEYNKNACFVIIDNKRVTLGQETPALKVFCNNTTSNSTMKSDATVWLRADFKLLHEEDTLQIVSSLLQRGAMKDLHDFDNHLDNPACDWTNQYLNRDLHQLLLMY